MFADISCTGMTCIDDKENKEKEDGISNKGTEQQQESGGVLEDPLSQHESTGSSTKQEMHTVDVEGETKEREVIKAACNDDGTYQHRKQEEQMVLEAGSKAAEIAKTVFGKPVCIFCLPRFKPHRDLDRYHLKPIVDC